MTFMMLLVNNVVQKMRTRVTNTISLYKLTNILLLFICFTFKLVKKLTKFFKFYNLFTFFNKLFLACQKLKIRLKQISNKGALVNLYKDIVLVTRVRIFCTTLFINNNIKVVIQIIPF